MRTLNRDERETIRLAHRMLSHGELRAVLVFYGLVSPAETGEATGWQKGDKIRYEDEEIGTVESVSREGLTVTWPNNGTHFYSWDDAADFEHIDPTAAVPEPEQTPEASAGDACPAPTPTPFTIGDRVCHRHKGAGTIAEIKHDPDPFYKVALDDGSDWWSLEPSLTPIETPAPTAATPWHVGQRIRWKSDGDLGTITQEIKDGYFVEFDCWRDDYVKGIWVPRNTECMEPIATELAPLAIGDRVRDSDGDCGIIKAIAGEWAWVQCERFQRPLSAMLKNLHRL